MIWLSAAFSAACGLIDPESAAAQLHEDLRAVAPRDQYWVDELAATLRDGSSLQLQAWAETRGLRPDTVSYVFKREFGVYPKRFRLECRTRTAWREIMRSTSSLTDVAFKVGFSDLAHLSRSVHVLTGRSPSDWRSIKSANQQIRACRSQELPRDRSLLGS